MLDDMRRLYERGPLSKGLVVDRAGAMVGPDCILVKRPGQDSYRVLPAAEAAVLQKFLLDQPDNPDLVV